MSSVSEATILASSVSWPSGTATKTTSSARRASASASRVTDHYGTPPAGSLTTIWTPPCGIVTGTYTKASETCMPPGWNIYWASNAGYYSPAICPSGFIPGCTRTLRQGPVVVAGETAVNCVPSGFSCPTSTGQYLSHAVKGTTIAAMIQVRWKATDLPSFQTHPLANADLNRLQATSGPGWQSGSGDLSTGVIVGIAVGAGLALLVFILCIIFLCSRRRQRNNKILYAPPLQHVPLMQQRAYETGGYQQGQLGIMGAPPPPYASAGLPKSVPHLSGYTALPLGDGQSYSGDSTPAGAAGQMASASTSYGAETASDSRRGFQAPAGTTATPTRAPSSSSPIRSEEETVAAELQDLQRRQLEIEERRLQLLAQQDARDHRTELQ
ncbi:uncharacterized protein E0L32_006459 [Thyridium curvatum]|uniref:Uncharacterized protein n=1 Tax=Thyridium curvatum TaxID=1093900 RepID=A0A507AZG0_9PEZI|nr:uncharacterized protein E0L32_006459 [Thyridium curvatum]TPX13033.1 hypothetical protein E0L32_006459 [Thyridium curvatum]